MRADPLRRPVAHAGVLVLRGGAAAACGLMIVLAPPAGRHLFAARWLDAAGLGALACCAVLVAVGQFTRIAAGAASGLCATAACEALLTRQPWFSLPVRDAELAIVFLALVCLGSEGRLWADRSVSHSAGSS